MYFVVFFPGWLDHHNSSLADLPFLQSLNDRPETLAKKKWEFVFILGIKYYYTSMLFGCIFCKLFNTAK